MELRLFAPRLSLCGVARPFLGFHFVGVSWGRVLCVEFLNFSTYPWRTVRSSVVGALDGALQALRMRKRKIPSSLFSHRHAPTSSLLR